MHSSYKTIKETNSENKIRIDKQSCFLYDKNNSKIMNISSFEKLLEKEMERKEFLLYLGLFLLAITGISNFLKSISESINTDKNTTTQHSFGSGAYGGMQKGGKS